MKKMFTISVTLGEEYEYDTRAFLVVPDGELAHQICDSLNLYVLSLMDKAVSVDLNNEFVARTQQLLGTSIDSTMGFSVNELPAVGSADDLRTTSIRAPFGPEDGNINTRIVQLESILTNCLDDHSPEEIEDFERELEWLNHIVSQWEVLGSVGYNPETETIIEPWGCFPAGSLFQELVEWFEEEYGVSIEKNFG